MICHSLDDTAKFATELAPKLTPGSVLALCGDLGAGKTTLTQLLVSEFHGKTAVTSPTFALLNIYEGNPPIYHMDWYRLKTADELAAMGAEDYLEGQGICIVEWADKFPNALPPHTLWLHITLNPDGSRSFDLNMSVHEDLALPV